MKNSRMNANFMGVAALILASKLLGFLRNSLVGSNLGTHELADVYNTIFNVPVLIFASIGIALSSVNIPTLTYFNGSKSRDERNSYISGLYTHITLIGSIVCLTGIIAAPLISRIMLHDLKVGLEAVSVNLTRIMLPTLVIISLVYLTTGVLQVHGYFLLSSVISIPFNIIIILSLVLWGRNITALGIVTTVGWLLQLLIQLPALIREKYRFSFKLCLGNTHITGIYKSLLPILVGNAALQMCLITDLILANRLAEGSAAAVSYGSNLFTIITSVFIVAISIVAFPQLSRSCLDGDLARVRQILGYIFRILLFVLVPYVIMVVFYHNDIIKLVYQRGNFTQHSTSMTSTAFMLFSFCVSGYAFQEVFNRVYYALKKYTTPMVLSILCFLINLILSFYAYSRFGINGIAASTALSTTVYAVIMGIKVKKEIGKIFGREFAAFALRMVPSVVGLLAVLVAFRSLNLRGTVTAFIIPAVSGAVVYLVFAYFAGAYRLIREDK